MKRIFTTIALFGLLAAGCTKTENLPENITPDTPDPGTTEETVHYLTLGLALPGGTGSRAGDPAPGEYENGSEEENAIKNIRFYFFKADGSAAPVRKNPNKGSNGVDSFYDYNEMVDHFNETNTWTQEDPKPTIEKEISLTVMLNIASETDMPKYVVAILNPTEALRTDKTNYSLTELAEVTADYRPSATKDEFVMSNSVYADTQTNGLKEGKAIEKMNYTIINGKLYTSKTEAEENATIIYVERAMARIDLTVGGTTVQGGASEIKPVTTAKPSDFDGNWDNVYDTGKEYKLYKAVEDEAAVPIYVEFLGWTVTSNPKRAHLLKDVEPTWTDGTSGTIFKKNAEPWNVAAYYRSFWGINPELADANDNQVTKNDNSDYEFFSYNNILPKTDGVEGSGEAYHPFPAKATNGNQYTSMYIQENAGLSATDPAVLTGHESKVIVAARLLNGNTGKAMQIVQYGPYFYEADALLKYFANQIDSHFYTKEDGGLSWEDLTYTTDRSYKKDAGVEHTGSYYAYVVLNTTSAGKTWYYKKMQKEGNEEKEVEVKVTDNNTINEYIESIVSNRLLYWKDGMTYYYFAIEHLGKENEPGYYGVVRNHIYRANISALSGLGTPVMEPKDPIYPETPKEEDYLLAAVIRVQQWRVVQQDYEFSW